MPAKCCVVGCSNRHDRDGGRVRFFRFPTDRRSKELAEITNARQVAWLNAIRRLDLKESSFKHTHICSEHFITGRPAKPRDKLNPDWVPNKNMGYRTRSHTSRYQRRKNRKLQVADDWYLNDATIPSTSVEAVSEISEIDKLRQKSGPKLSDRFQTQVEHCPDVQLEKIEEIYYKNDASDFERESIADMSAEYLEANYLSEDTVDQMECIDVADNTADFLVEDSQESFKKNKIEYLDKDNDNLAALEADRIRAETVYFQKKSEYIDICIEKERRLQPLLIAKLELEIENLMKKRDDNS